MAFHRFTVPTYYGGLPGGYDYINNAVTGTPAQFDGPRVEGPNAGSYFLGFGEDGRSIFVNRGLKALSENTDLLDDRFHRDLVTLVETVGDTAVGPVDTIELTGPDIFLGASGTPDTPEGIYTFIRVLSLDRLPVSNLTDGHSRVVSLTGGTVGSGDFSAGNVTLTIDPPIPHGSTYRVHYGVRTLLKEQPMHELSFVGVRAAQEVSPLLMDQNGSGLVGTIAGPNWHDGTTNPIVSAQNRMYKTIADLVHDNGSDRIGSSATAGTPFALSAGSAKDQLSYLLGGLNTLNDDLVNGLSNLNTAIINGDAGVLGTILTALQTNSVRAEVLNFYASTLWTPSVTHSEGNPSWTAAYPMVALLEGWGGGGGGGYGGPIVTAENHWCAGGGGGGGAQRHVKLVILDKDVSYQITVGNGGTGGTNGSRDGSPGGDSAFAIQGGDELARFPGAGGGMRGDYLNKDDEFVVTHGGRPTNTSTPWDGTQPLVVPLGLVTLGMFGVPGCGGEGVPRTMGGRAGSRSIEGFDGGVGGASGADDGTWRGGGGGGGGAAGPLGPGGAGGAGGAGWNAGSSGGGNGGNAQLLAQWSGAGGGGGGAPGNAATGGGGNGGNGNQGLIRITLLAPILPIPPPPP